MRIGKAVDIFLGIMFSIGLIGMILSFACRIGSHVGMRVISSNLRFPLGSDSSWAFNEKCWIYCLSFDHNRLQIFDSNGCFVKGWFVDTNPGDRIWVDTNDLIHIVNSSDRDLVFDVNGITMENAKKEGLYNCLYQFSDNPVGHDATGNIYRPHQSIMATCVTKFNHNAGTKTVILTDTFYIWIFRILLPWAIIFVVPLLVWVAKYGMWPDFKRWRTIKNPTDVKKEENSGS
jgi:hypothetical protein